MARKPSPYPGPDASQREMAEYYEREAAKEYRRSAKLQKDAIKYREWARGQLDMGRWHHRRGDHTEELAALGAARSLARLARSNVRFAESRRSSARHSAKMARTYAKRWAELLARVEEDRRVQETHQEPQVDPELEELEEAQAIAETTPLQEMTRTRRMGWTWPEPRTEAELAEVLEVADLEAELEREIPDRPALAKARLDLPQPGHARERYIALARELLARKAPVEAERVDPPAPQCSPGCGHFDCEEEREAGQR